MEKQILEGKLVELIELGDKVRNYFHIEKCNPYGNEYEYLNSLPEDEWDDEDKAASAEFEELKGKIAEIHVELKKLGAVGSVYQKFYTQGLRVISAVAPERLVDFESQYKRKTGNLKSPVDYTISDGLNGIRNVGRTYTPSTALKLIQNQIDILISIKESLGTVLFEIEQTLRMDLFDSEVESARHLSGGGHLRAAGAVLGVVLEEHLKSTAIRYGYSSGKKAPTISDFNDFLKAQGVIDTVIWRRIQGLGDIRNLCDHAKDREPTSHDVDDLAAGVERILKTVL